MCSISYSFLRIRQRADFIGVGRLRRPKVRTQWQRSHKRSVRDLAFYDSGTLFTICSNRGLVQWDVETSKKVFYAFTFEVTCIFCRNAVCDIVMTHRLMQCAHYLSTEVKCLRRATRKVSFVPGTCACLIRRCADWYESERVEKMGF